MKTLEKSIIFISVLLFSMFLIGFLSFSKFFVTVVILWLSGFVIAVVYGAIRGVVMCRLIRDK